MSAGVGSDGSSDAIEDGFGPNTRLMIGQRRGTKQLEGVMNLGVNSHRVQVP
ncbi:hypothetical protein Pd630_LPD11002 (plasmid) [Rhodococcus opacus PD630]|nr:hypothetical protein Pd630_LPD11002 [Rhodococcus opacus PD630]